MRKTGVRMAAPLMPLNMATLAMSTHTGAMNQETVQVIRARGAREQ